MNAPHRLFVITRPAAYLAMALTGLGLTACAPTNIFATAPVDPRSPIAGDVAALAHQNKAFPTFASIPPEPQGLRPIKAWGQSALQIEAAGRKLERETADNTWTLTGTEDFAAAGLRQAGPAIAVGESTTAATEAYVREMRKRATPPPPPKR
jgi:hypothetical protein